MHAMQSRRDFLSTMSAAGAASVLGPRSSFANEPPPEVTTIRLPRDPSICIAPEQIADVMLRAEGFTDVRYLQVSHSGEAVVRGEVDFGSETAAWLVTYLDAGQPITALAGIHVGCYELFAHQPISSIRDLKGRRVGIPQAPGSSGHLLLAVMAAQVGLDPHTDINWITKSNGDFMAAFAEGEVDAFLAFPPEPQELRARKIGRVILNTGTDKPWSQYFCCTEFGNRDFVRAHPIATKRYLRALLKAADFCAAEPEMAAQRLVDAGFTGRYDYALQTLTEIPYAQWREYDPQDAMRFYALRLHEVGMITSSPNALLADGTDWRFLNELKRELKA
jgi:NitT/TauT family transport system substrate-binding protein